MGAAGFPAWYYHAQHGGRKFADPEALEKAGKGWHDTPSEVGLAPSVPQGVNAPMAFKAIEQPIDESVATPLEAEQAAKTRSRKAPAAVSTVASRRRATAH
jgi:hypothetical protein